MATPEEMKLLELSARHAIAEESGSSKGAPGTLSARERIALLLDEGTFEETGKFVTHRATDFEMAAQRPLGDGVITGYGRIHKRLVCIFAHDATVFGGSISEANAAKIVNLIDTAMHMGTPLIGLHDARGIRMQEGISAVAGATDVLLHHIRASGIIPQIAAIFGPCTDIAAFSPALADLVLTTSPTGEAHLLASVRELLTFVPSSNQDTSPRKSTPDEPTRAELSLDTLIPAGDQPYNMLEVITRIVDQNNAGQRNFFPLQEHVAPNILTGFARMDGRPVGIVANEPAFLDGVLDSGACVKAARFVRFCDAFHIPLITFVDTPGVQSEQADIQHAVQLLRAFAEATVPRFTVIVRKAYGTGYGVMSSKHLRADLNLAWPTAEIVAAEPEAAINILYQRELESLVQRVQATMPQGVALSEEQKLEILTEARKEKVAAYRDRFANPYVAAERGYIDAVIRPSETRRRLNTALDMRSSNR